MKATLALVVALAPGCTFLHSVHDSAAGGARIAVTNALSVELCGADVVLAGASTRASLRETSGAASEMQHPLEPGANAFVVLPHDFDASKATTFQLAFHGCAGSQPADAVATTIDGLVTANLDGKYQAEGVTIH